MKRVLPIVLLLVAGCAVDPSGPAPVVEGAQPAQRAAAAPPRVPRPGAAQPGAPRASAAAPAGAARFDGTYRGVRTTLVSGGDDCTRTAAPRNLVVQDGAARVVWNPALGSAFAGSVGDDGALRLALDQPPAPAVMTGAIAGAEAKVRTEAGDCSYEMSWRRMR